MRSLLFTLTLALLATVACLLAGWQLREGNFNALLGPPPTPVGERVYQDFNPPDVKRIKVSQSGVVGIFELGDKGWKATTPWQDRMDPRAAAAIINFALTMRVEDSAPVGEINEESAGFAANAIEIRLYGKDNVRLARFKIGRRTPWLATVKDIDKPVQTVFVQPRDEKHKGRVYVCTGDITVLFKDGMKFLRDHHPLQFNPANLQTIRIRAEQGDLTLARESPAALWRVVKPMDLPTNLEAMKALVGGLQELQAAKVSDRVATPLPAGNELAKSWQISLANFGSDQETTLEIFPSEQPEASTARATVSDRPNSAFELPLKPTANVVSVADLPLAVNDLRDPALMKLDISSLREISIQPPKSPGILVSRIPPAPWMATIDGVMQEANEERLFTFLKAISESAATGFESDAATDFTPWGLDQPFLKLRFTGAETQELRFGRDSKGGIFLNREGTPAVMEVDPGLLAAIPSRAYEWRHSRVWSIDRTNLLAIERQAGSEKNSLLLHFDDHNDEWTAERLKVGPDNLTKVPDDVTSSLDAGRANFLLGALEGLKVTRWLPPDEPTAMAALATPALTFTVSENRVDDDGEVVGKQTRRVLIAAASDAAKPAFYYGCLASDSQPFLLDRETYTKLATEVLEKE